MKITIFSIIPFLSSFLILTLGIIVYFKNKRNKINISFLNFSIAIFVWLFSYSIAFSVIDHIQSIFWVKLAFTGVVFIPTTIFIFVLSLLNKPSKEKFTYYCYSCSFLFTYLVWFTSLLLNEPKEYFWGSYAIASHLHPIVIIYIFTLFISSIFLLISQSKKLHPNSFDFHKYRLIAYSIVFGCLACVDFIPNYGIEIYPFGWFFVNIYTSILAYTIIRYKLLNIKFVIQKSLIYSFLISSLALLYLIIIILLEKLAQSMFSYNSNVISIITALFIGLIFIPLRNRVQRFVDTKIFKKNPFEIIDENTKLLDTVSQSEKYKSLSTLSSGVAHEIKNPLTALKTFCEYLPEKLEDKEFLTKFSNLIGKEVDRIDDMVHQLLDYGKPSPIVKKEVFIRKFIDDTLTMLNNELIKHHIQLERNYNVPLSTTLNVDSNKIKQALLNIFMNAIDAMPDGGTLTIGIKDTGLEDQRTKEELTSNPKILNSSNPQLIQISITDTGIGMSKDELKQVFDPFFTNKDNGTGLGMSITQSIIEKHGGTLKVMSEKGVGTEVGIEIPKKVIGYGG